jgi:type II secretory pathway component PulK
MPIDPKRPVYLKQMIVDPRSGNVLPALPTRTYELEEIPERFRTEEYCTQDSLPVHEPYSKLVETKMLGDITDRTLAADLMSLPTPPVIAPPSGEPKPSVNVNTASAEAIAEALEGIGPKTAEKVVEERQSQMFTSTEDLDKRVPLGFKRVWSSHATQISF